MCKESEQKELKIKSAVLKKYKQFFCLFHDLKLCFCLEKAFLN